LLPTLLQTMGYTSVFRWPVVGKRERFRRRSVLVKPAEVNSLLVFSVSQSSHKFEQLIEVERLWSSVRQKPLFTRAVNIAPRPFQSTPTAGTSAIDGNSRCVSGADTHHFRLEISEPRRIEILAPRNLKRFGAAAG